MDDITYDFVQDSIHKKQIGKSAFRKGKHRARPDINRYSKKELQAMNGELKIYDLSKAMLWAEFKQMPDDLKKEYLVKLYEHGGTHGIMGDMFGVAPDTVQNMARKLGFPKQQGRLPDREKWSQWLSGSSVTEEETPEQITDQILSDPTELPLGVPVENCSQSNTVQSTSSGMVTIIGKFSELCDVLMPLVGDSRKVFTVQFEPVVLDDTEFRSVREICKGLYGKEVMQS